ncbi:MAG: DNA repair protein RecN [Pseudomonadota bacterium]
MLSHLSIRDFVIVDALELEFTTGFTVLTGETGAGKSILIDALSLTLGGRAEAGVVRPGSERAEITAEFDLGDSHRVTEWLKENQLEGDEGVVFLRRTVESGGRSRAFINGRTATAQQLKDIGEQLVDIHGQHAHQSLLRRDAQRNLLDSFGGLTEVVSKTSERYRLWQKIRETRLDLARNAELVAAERDQLNWQIRELTTLAFEPNAWQETVAEHARLSHAASLIEGAEAGLNVLSESDGAVISAVASTLARLQELADVDQRLKEITDVLEPAQIQLQEAAYGLRHYLQRLELDPGRLVEVERRLSEVHEMARKYRATPEELPVLLNTKQSRLEELGGSGNEEELLAREQAAEAAYMETAKKLSEGRKKAAAMMSKQVTASMQTLAMTGGRFEAALQPGNPAAFGLEQVEFQVASHEGMPLGSLAKVASGGELSRISLAIQVILSKIAAIPTLIFDEVDVGIGGRVAEVVGQLLQQLGNTHQVMCVTHLPQVAASGSQHWRVAKSAVSGGVRSRIESLDAEARVEELARMLGGVKITETTRKHAKEMLGVK